MRFSICFYLFVLYGFVDVLSQKFITPLRRKAYVIENEKIKLQWSIDMESKQLEFARWAVARTNAEPYRALVAFEKSTTSPKVFDNSIVEADPVFGDVTLLTPNPTDYKFISVSIDFLNEQTPLSDQVELIYVENTPLVNTQLPSQKTYVENKGELTNQKFTINVMGRNLQPMIVWKLNGENITQFNSFSLTQNISVGNQVVEETLTIAQILPYCNGILSAEARYGLETDISVNVISETVITYKFSPKFVGITTNISKRVVYTETTMKITCETSAVPYVIYQFIIAGEIEHTSSNGTFEYKVRKYYSAKYLSVHCFVYNELGNATSLKLLYTVQNSTSSARQESEVEWMTYFLVACVIALVALIGVSATLCVVRSRMRSMNIKTEANKLRERSLTNRTDYENKAMRHNGSNHVYDLNQRGRPDGTQRTNNMNGIENDGFGLYDEF